MINIIRQKESFLKKQDGSMRIVSPIKNGSARMKIGYFFLINFTVKKTIIKLHAAAQIIFVNSVVDMPKTDESCRIMLPPRPRLINPPR